MGILLLLVCTANGHALRTHVLAERFGKGRSVLIVGFGDWGAVASLQLAIVALDQTELVQRRAGDGSEPQRYACRRQGASIPCLSHHAHPMSISSLPHLHLIRRPPSDPPFSSPIFFPFLVLLKN